MPILVRCEKCERKLSIPSRKAGREVSCPACRHRFVVPERKAKAEEKLAEDEATVVDPAIAAAAMLEEETLREPLPSETKPHHLPDDDDEVVEDDDGFVLSDRCGEVEEMDLTPMVDVTFLLLIFFMITASFSLQKVLDVPPPDKSDAAAQTVMIEDVQDTSIIVQVTSDDRLIVDDEDYAGDLADLGILFRRKMAEEDKRELVVNLHTKSTHGMKVIVVDAAQEAQLQKIRISVGDGAE